MNTQKIDTAKINAINDGNFDQHEAKALLKTIGGNIVNKDGTIKPGVFRLVRSKDGKTATLSTARWFQFRSDSEMREGSELISKLVAAAHPGLYDAKLRDNLRAYLRTTASKFGSKSFVKLLGALQGEQDDGGKKGAPRTEGRITLHASVADLYQDLTASSKLKEIQIEKLMSHLDQETKECFLNLLYLEKGVKTLGTPPTFTLGDARGSLSRIALMAIQSGHMTLDDEGLKALGRAMNKEAKAITTEEEGLKFDHYEIGEGFQSFQKDKDLSDDLAMIVTHATYLKSSNQLVCIGNILYERLSNNQRATVALLAELKEKGAVFIRGKHDVYDKAGGISHGKDATKKLSENEAKEIEEKLFVNAHHDDKNNIFYSHNGYKWKSNSRIYLTACGEIETDNPGQLAWKMINTPIKADLHFKFRPKNQDMQPNVLGPLGKYRGKNSDKSLLNVHGQNPIYGSLDNVLNVNARNSKGYRPTGFVI